MPDNPSPDPNFEINLKPSQIVTRTPIGDIVTLNADPIPDIGPIGVLPQSDGTYLAAGKPGAPCTLWRYDRTGHIIWEKQIKEPVPEIDRCRNGIGFAEGFFFIGSDTSGTRTGVMTNTEIAQAVNPLPKKISTRLASILLFFTILRSYI